MDEAFADLCAIGGDGVQLTPGNLPTPGFADTVASADVMTRSHHGFCWDEYRQPVWDPDTGHCLVTSDSVHPPQERTPEGRHWPELVANQPLPILEIMHPGYALGCGHEIGWAMDQGLSLAVDVSHVYIQRCQGAMSEAMWRRLQDYTNIAEIHVSANNGRKDLHWPIAASTFGVSWARARMNAGTPLVLECYMHKLPSDARERQVAILRPA